MLIAVSNNLMSVVKMFRFRAKSACYIWLKVNNVPIGNAIGDITKQNNGRELLCEVGDGKE